MAVAVAVAILVGLAFAGYKERRQRGSDRTAIRLADQVVANLQHYAARHGGAYPAKINGYWPSIMGRLAPDNELPVKPPPGIFKTWAGDEGDAIHGYSDATGSTYQLIFRAVGGTGKIYCRDPQGLAPVAPSLLGKPGPWTGCPSSTPPAIVARISPDEADQTALKLADQLAANLQRYAARHGGAYPAKLNGYWPTIVQKLGPDSEWPVKPPPAIFKTWAGDEGDAIHGYSDATGSTFQLIFRAAGGTGKVYCRDPKGLAPVDARLFGTPGPWTGCP